jgi:hypothetical protein
MAAGSGLPRGARIIHRGADELLIQQNSVPDGEITLPIQEGTSKRGLSPALYVLNSSYFSFSGQPCKLVALSCDADFYTEGFDLRTFQRFGFLLILTLKYSF